jgi:hypothetical protein
MYVPERAEANTLIQLISAPVGHPGVRALLFFGLDLSHNVCFRPNECIQVSILALSVPIALPRGLDPSSWLSGPVNASPVQGSKALGKDALSDQHAASCGFLLSL